MRRPALRRTLPAVAVVIGGVGAVVVGSLPDPSQPVLVGAGLASAACLAAAATGLALAGTAAVVLVAATVLGAAVVDPGGARPLQLVVAAALLLVLVTALDRAEQGAGDEVAVLRRPLPDRAGLPLLGLGGAGLVALVGARDVVPSVPAVVVGVCAAVAALLVATRVHRRVPAHPDAGEARPNRDQTDPD